MHNFLMKRVMDVLISGTLIILLSPIVLIISLIILVKMGRPIWFIQPRSGLEGKPFSLYKFRTMTDQKDRLGSLMDDGQRLTSLGIFLRKYSLDEIPQLFNVLRGNMTLVGPRPLLMEYLPMYTKEQSFRHSVKPGITGWAQINGRNAISWEEKFRLDNWYVENQSLLLDCKILLVTLLRVIRKEGINQQNSLTMEKFTGSKEVL